MRSIRRVLTMFLAAAFVLPLVSCGNLDKMMGKKDEKAEQAEQKLKEMEAKMQQMEAEAKARKEAEEKAKIEQEMRAKIEAEMKAKAETQPAPATTQPAAPKVVEKIIVKEKEPAKPTAAAPSAPAPAAEATPSRASGFVRLYDDAGFTDRILTVRFGRDIGNMHYVNSDDGKAGFNDKASSVKWSVPPGWQAVLYENDNYSKRGYSLKGSGSVPDLGYFGDKCSSIRWERAGE